MTRVLAWLRKIPVIGWVVLGLVAVGLVAWRLLVRAWNAERRLALAVRLAANRRLFETAEQMAGVKAAEERAAARQAYEAQKRKLEARRAAISAAKPAKLADEINRVFGGG